MAIKQKPFVTKLIGLAGLAHLLHYFLQQSGLDFSESES